MKKLTVLIILVLSSGIALTQNRGGRNVVQRNNNTNLNVNVNVPSQNVYYNLDNNVGNLNVNYVQTSNVSFNTNKVQVQEQPQMNVNSRGMDAVTNRNVDEILSNEDIQIVNYRGNRGGNEVEIVQEFNPVSRGNSNVIEMNVLPQETQQVVNEPVQLQMSIDNVDEQLTLNTNPNINVQAPNINVDLSLNLNVANQSPQEVISGNTKKTKQTKVKEEKDITFSMPNIDLGSSNKAISTKKTASKTISKRTKKVKRPRGFSYRQHVTILQKIKSKSSGIKKMLKKKKSKKTKCSVVCYQF